MRTHGSSRDEDSYSLSSLKERMTRAVEPMERAISTCPTGSWLDGLRTSFEPGNGRKPKPEPSPNPEANLLSRRLRSA